MVNAYPGDNYVDIVGTDIYNNIYPGPIPWWRSFRWQATESYYYLSKYFPTKPLFICELGCRERDASEPVSSETKAGWFARMDKELQSNFHKTRGLIFFSSVVAYDWTINTSSASIQSLRDNFWYDDYYFIVPSAPVSIYESVNDENLFIYPNPSSGNVTLKNTNKENVFIRVLDISGKQIQSQLSEEIEKTQPGSATKTIDISGAPAGTYFIECKTANDRKIQKIIIQ
jgi:hypothetical protein